MAFAPSKRQFFCGIQEPHAGHNFRIRILLRAPVVDQVAIPRGLLDSISIRIESERSVVTNSTIFSLSIHASICDGVTRRRMWYQRPLSNCMYLAVSLCAA